MSQINLGIVTAALGALGFGLMPIFAKIAFESGVGPVSLMVWRYGVASLIGLLYCIEFVRLGRQVIGPLLAGALFGGVNVFYFYGLQHLPVALTGIIFFSFPLFAILFEVLFFRVSFTLKKSVSLLFILAATLMSFSFESMGGLDVIWIALTFISPAGYGLFLVLSSRFLAKSTVTQRMPGIYFGALFVMMLTSLFLHGSIEWPNSANGLIACLLIGVVSTVGALTLTMIGLKLAGSFRTSVAGASEIFVCVAVGGFWFHEPIHIAQWIGAALIFLANLNLAERDDV